MRRLDYLWLVAALIVRGTNAFLPTVRRGQGLSGFGSFTSSSTTATFSPITTTQLYGDLRAARDNVAQGMQAFRQGKVEQSIQFFDAAQAAEPQYDLFLWQRGLSYYYANDFDKASQQFRRDVGVNPRDVEEIVWDIASQLRAGATFPVPSAMTLPAPDRRPIMNVVYGLFKGTATEHDLAAAGHASGQLSDEFYALLYLGLYCEGRQEMTKAEQYMRQAVHTEYAQNMGRRDYMTDVARVRSECFEHGISTFQNITLRA